MGDLMLLILLVGVIGLVWVSGYVCGARETGATVMACAKGRGIYLHGTERCEVGNWTDTCDPDPEKRYPK